MPTNPGDHALKFVAEAWTRRKGLGLAIASVAGAAGVTLALSLPNVYLATATVLVERPAIDPRGPFELESRLLQIGQEVFSRSVMEGLIARFNLYPGQPPGPALVERLRKDIRTEHKLQPQPSGIGATYAFAISYQGNDPEIAMEVANWLAAAYIKGDQQIRERQTTGAVKVLKAQLDDVKRNLEEQERALAEFQDRHMGELPEQTEVSLANLQRLHVELRTASDERIRALDRRNELLRQLADADAAGGSTSIGPAPAAMRLAKLRQELDELTQRYSDKYPDVIRVKEEVASLEREIAAQARIAGGARAPDATSRTSSRLREALAEIDGDIKTSKSNEARLRAEIGDRILRLENAPRQQRGYQEVARDHQTTRDLYDSLRKRYEQAELEEPAANGQPGSSPLRILEPAIVPTSPAAPNRWLLLVAALFGSLAMAVAAVALAERLDTSLRSSDDVRSFTRVPVVASIPLIVTVGDLRARRRRLGLATLSLLLVVGVVVHTVHGVARTSDRLVSILAKGRP